MKVFAIDALARAGAETAKGVAAAHTDEPFERNRIRSPSKRCPPAVLVATRGWEFPALVTDRHWWIR